MVDVIQLQRKYREHQATILREGFLNDQFNQLQKMQDESSPNFVMEIVSTFYEHCAKLLNSIARALDQKPVDFKSIDLDVHQFKGSSASVGAARVTNVSTNFRHFCQAQNLEGCMRCLLQLHHEYSLFKDNLQYLLRLQQEIRNAGGSVPPME